MEIQQIAGAGTSSQSNWSMRDKHGGSVSQLISPSLSNLRQP